MPKTKLPFVSLAFLAAHIVAANPANASEFDTFPTALFCTVSDSTFVLYLTKLDSDGSALYAGVSGGAVTASKDGLVEPVATMNPGDCAGRTIDELRKAGKARDFAG